VSSIQTGVFAGPAGSAVSPGSIRTLWPPFWMIGYEEEPERSAETCICARSSDTTSARTRRRWDGRPPVRRPRIVDESSAETVAIDAREFCLYAAEWTPSESRSRRRPAHQDRPPVDSYRCSSCSASTSRRRAEHGRLRRSSSPWTAFADIGEGGELRQLGSLPPSTCGCAHSGPAEPASAAAPRDAGANRAPTGVPACRPEEEQTRLT
jgi:hypothetical protein